MKTKEYERQIREIHKLFNGNPPQWLIDKITEHYERTRGNDLSKLGSSVFKEDDNGCKK